MTVGLLTRVLKEYGGNENPLAFSPGGGCWQHALVLPRLTRPNAGGGDSSLESQGRGASWHEFTTKWQSL